MVKLVEHILDKAYYDPICWDEHYLDEWFQKNHKKLGFSKIKESIPIIGCADYIGERNGKELIIELEGPLSHINSHQQKVLDLIDVVICFGGYASVVDNKEVIRLCDYPQFLKDAVNQKVVHHIKNRNAYLEVVQKKFTEDTRML